MKKIWIVVAVVAVVVIAGLGAVGVAYAQDGAFPGRGPMMADGNEGPLHEYMVDAFAQKLGMTSDALEARLDAGETMYEVALSQGITAEQFPALMTEARTQAIKAAVADGVLTQEQADWMLQHQGGRGAGKGEMMGSGACNGTGIPVGSGMRGGGRWQQTNP